MIYHDGLKFRSHHDICQSIVLPAITAQDLQFIRMLGSASHESLLQSNNPYYARLYQESMILKALIDNEKFAGIKLWVCRLICVFFCSRLQARILELEERLHQESMILKARVDNERFVGIKLWVCMLLMCVCSRLQARISELEERLSAVLAVRSHPNGSEACVLLPLSIPAPLAPLQRTDFTDVPFWTLKEWNHHKAAEQRRNETIHKLAFITNTCGELVANEYLEQMSDTAQMFFNELHTHGLAPPTWKAKSKAASDFSSTIWLSSSLNCAGVKEAVGKRRHLLLLDTRIAVGSFSLQVFPFVNNSSIVDNIFPFR